ncbi:serine/threonine protein kinase Hsk1 [Eremomyces bilateralis CBS 781.70]|uniref:non-specific serine/threonine protein kinase n=1 Tax=Eremomyces bilateralis CBS 781.70 TaxID=1392243 RepID=A0A6G1FTN8_9PEZI|nr:serine/threonine protein kinase Hsk1 [Eremomyces bilateralis CBS 781.70]KAF1809039.1 serine/threonine protein kinase Hsk1 [Eremomyces bilateralis CBS 781.70]
MDESRDPQDESGCTLSDESEEEVDESVAEDMVRLENDFQGIASRYRLINRIGEGTFSTVYKAEDLQYNAYKNGWDAQPFDNSSPQKRQSRGPKPRFVAIKKIYVTSSPSRILNELELLHDLRDSDAICPLITAFRHQDQVIAILPFCPHRDFRDYYKGMSMNDVRVYMRSLFVALQSVHDHGILHRDVKPTNFLYSPSRGRGLLVDFGLAERAGTDYHFCCCELAPTERQSRFQTSTYKIMPSDRGRYPNQKTDTRPTRRANRAGTRGFRAPEVLFKCTAQTTAIDIWSAGVMLLTFLTKRFPFFHSADDIDAVLEMAALFGKKKMHQAGMLHGQMFETNIPTYRESGYSWEKIVLWASGRDGSKGGRLHQDEKDAIEFMELCFAIDPKERITATGALEHPFINSYAPDDAEDMVDLL